MKKARRASIFILGAMILVSPCLSVPSISFGELLLPVPVEGETTKTEPSPKEIKDEVVSFPPGSSGFRSEESGIAKTSDQLLPLGAALSTEEQELVETTDASGGTMINLQGRFQSVLKVPRESMDSPVEEPLSPTIP